MPYTLLLILYIFIYTQLWHDLHTIDSTHLRYMPLLAYNPIMGNFTLAHKNSVAI